MDLWWSEATSDGTKRREHSRQSCWKNHFCLPKWITLELEGKQFSTEEVIALASFSLYQAVLRISKLLYLCGALANLPEEEPSFTAVPSPSWTTLPYSAGEASHPQAGTTYSCRQSLTLPTLPLCFISRLAPLECSSSMQNMTQNCGKSMCIFAFKKCTPSASKYVLALCDGACSVHYHKVCNWLSS